MVLKEVTCRYANITLGQSCIVDNTTYTDTGPNGEQYMFTVMRDNCRSPQFYCDPGSSVCQRTKAVGMACQLDSECEEVCSFCRSLFHFGFHRRFSAKLQLGESLRRTSRDTPARSTMAVGADNWFNTCRCAHYPSIAN